MSVVPKTAPWQLGPVSSLGRITAASLLALSVDAVGLTELSPNVLIGLTFVFAPLLVGIRVARGFDRSLPTAMITLGLVGIAIGAQLALGAPVYGNSRNALAVAAALVVSGLVAAVAAWFEHRRWNKPAVIELTRTNTRDPFARARGR